MSYDNTSFYGDMIVDEYDEKNNFIGTNTPMGYLAYHLLGDGFDLMSDMCSKFMNDFSILSASASSLDKFWGVSYNMPRPSLDTLGSTIFEDKGIILDYTNWSYRYNMTIVRTDAYSYTQQIDSTVFGYVAQTITSGDTVEADVCISGLGVSSAFISIRKGTTSVGTVSLSNLGLSVDEWGHMKLILNGTSMDIYCDGVFKTTKTLSANDYNRIQFSINANATNTHRFKNFVIYDMDTPSTRPMTDDEYKIYLYLRNCRLITKEDLLINFNKCFGFDDYPIVFSDENFYLEATDHLNYEPADTVSSNLHKNSEDPTLHFVTDYSNDETTETIESGLTTEEELVTVINIPYNNWDNEFLEMLEQYISIKGNIKIKEYTL